jgi:hypothetical protein
MFGISWNAVLFNPLLLWLVEKDLATIKTVWKLLSELVFTTPDVTTLPQVVTISNTSLTIVNVTFILAIIAVGITVMARETVQTRYGVSELLPRLVIGFVAANFGMPICTQLIQFANALTLALTGDGIDSAHSMAQMLRIVAAALINPSDAMLAAIIGLLIAALTAMLLGAWIVRLGVLIVLVGIAPVALACHATPYTDPAARLWWRSWLACLGIVVLQALALHTALSIFLDPKANLPAIGLPKDPTGTLNLFIVVCLLWTVVKIPSLVRRFVVGGGGQRNIGGLVVRMLLVQQLTGLLRLPLRGGGRRAAAAAGGARGGTAGRVGGGGRLPRPVGGGGARPRATTGGTSTGKGGRGLLAPPRGASAGRVGVAWPTGRPVRPYTTQEIAAGVDSYTRTVPTKPLRSTRPPIRAAGVQAPPQSGPPPTIPAGVNPGTAMPKTRPTWQPSVSGPSNYWPTPPPRRVPPGVTPDTAMPKTRPTRPPATGSWSRPTRRR